MSTDTKRAIRTALQTLVAVALVLPAIVREAGIPETLPWVAAALAISGALARVMALPSVQGLLSRIGLSTDDEGSPTDRTLRR